MEKVHYELFGYPRNPALEDVEHTHKFMASNKREVIGLCKTMLDNFDCEHIAIFKVRGLNETRTKQSGNRE
jgi:hypothetical protein